MRLRNPYAPATDKQLYALHQLTGKDTRNWELTMQQASDKIEELELKKLEQEFASVKVDESQPFDEPHIQIVEGDQRGGKSVYAVKTIFTDYNKDAIKIFCKNVLGIDVDVLNYKKGKRIAKIRHQGVKKYIHITEQYKLWSPKRVFSNIHLFGIPYVWAPSFRHMLHWLKIGFISDGWLLSDESVHGMSARNGMSAMGKEFVGQYYQFGKSKLDVIIITHHARELDYNARLIPSKRIHCTYEKTTFRVTYSMREKGKPGTVEYSFDAREWFGNYLTNEKVNA